jgi:hypothetical protein
MPRARGSVVLPYCRDMPVRKRPAPDDAVAARQTLLDGLARDPDIFELLSELAPLHPPGDTFPGEVFLYVAADALDWCGASRADPLPLEGLCERFLPERTFRGRQNTKLQYAVLAAAALHGGTEPDLLAEAAWWQAGDFWQVRAVRGGRLRSRRRRPGGCAGAPGMRAPGRAPWAPGAIRTSSGHSRSGHVTAGRPMGSGPAGRLTQGAHRGSWRGPASSLSRGPAGCELAWSRAARSADNPRAVWLFTAPRLMRIAAAISRSDRPA